jgi:hypothetical protein
MAGMVYVDTDELVISTQAYDNLNAEVERLRTEYDCVSEAMIAYQNRCGELFTEVERLRTELADRDERILLSG